MVQRAMKSDRKFGMVTTDGVGTLATMDDVDLQDDGRAMVVLSGGRRFNIRRRWSEKCTGCPHPLNHAAVTFFNDSIVTAPGEASDLSKLAKEGIRRYMKLTGASYASVRAALEERLGPLPSVHGAHGAYGVSMWLSAACNAHPACASALAEQLLRGVSTRERLERIVAFQKALQQIVDMEQEEAGDARRF